MKKISCTKSTNKKYEYFKSYDTNNMLYKKYEYFKSYDTNNMLYKSPTHYAQFEV